MPPACYDFILCAVFCSLIPSHGFGARQGRDRENPTRDKRTTKRKTEQIKARQLATGAGTYPFRLVRSAATRRCPQKMHQKSAPEWKEHPARAFSFCRVAVSLSRTGRIPVMWLAPVFDRSCQVGPLFWAPSLVAW